MRFLAAYIMRGRWQATLVASTLALLSLVLPPFTVFSSAAVSLVTLRKGAYEGLYVLLISCVAAVALGIFTIRTPWFGVIFSITQWLPVWLISIVLREGRSLSLALAIATWLGALAVVGMYLYFPEPAAAWQETIDTVIKSMPTSPNIPAQQVEQTRAVLPHYFTGSSAAGYITVFLFGLLLARWWQALLYYPGGFRQEFLALTARRSMTYGGLLAFAVGLAGLGKWSEAAWNVFIVVLAAHFFVGIAVLHSLLTTPFAKRFWLPALGIVLFLILPQLVMPITALLGFSDSWINLRKRINP